MTTQPNFKRQPTSVTKKVKKRKELAANEKAETAREKSAEDEAAQWPTNIPSLRLLTPKAITLSILQIKSPTDTEAHFHSKMELRF